MTEIKGVKFDDTIAVLFSIKEKKGHKTLDETYKYLDEQQIDSILEVLVISYNLAHEGNEVDDKGFGKILGAAGIGFAKMATVYAQLIEKIMFDGMSDEEVADLKKQRLNLKK